MINNQKFLITTADWLIFKGFGLDFCIIASPQLLNDSLLAPKSCFQHIQCIRSECSSDRNYFISCHPASCGATSCSKRSDRGGNRRPDKGTIGSDFHRELPPQTRGGFAQRTVWKSRISLKINIKFEDLFDSRRISKIKRPSWASSALKSKR